MTKSKTLFYLSISFIVGIFFSLKFEIPFLLPLILGLFLIFKRPFLGLILISLSFGLWRGSLGFYQEIQEYYNQDVILKGEIVREPDVREDNTKLVVETEKGKILATVSKFSDYSFSEKVRIEGKLLSPPVFEDFDYKSYLKKDGISSVIYYPKVEVLEESSGLVYSKILWLKDKMRNVLYDNLSPPKNFILGAMILGDKSRMPSYLKEKLNRAGVRHITAVSGMHVVILSSIIMSFLLGLGLWRGQAFYFSLAAVFLFVLFIGFHPSAVRAGIMAGIFLLGEKMGRRGISSRILFFVAAIMLLFNPFLLLYDAGFQLSFLAVLGIIYFSSFFKRMFSFIPNWFNLREILAMTFSAQVFTLPLLIYQFGSFSLATPLANLLILPFIYWVIIFGFVFLFSGLLSPFLGFIFSFPCFIILLYISTIINLFSVSWFSKTEIELHWIWLLAFYAFLFFLAFILRHKERLGFLKY